MADIAKAGRPSLATKTPGYEQQIAGYLAGEAMAAGDTVYMHSDGRWRKVVGSTAAAASRFWGMVMEDAAANEPVTVFNGVRVRYGSGLTPGALLYRSPDVAGALADANATSGVTAPVAAVIAPTLIQLFGFVA